MAKSRGFKPQGQDNPVAASRMMKKPDSGPSIRDQLNRATRPTWDSLQKMAAEKESTAKEAMEAYENEQYAEELQQERQKRDIIAEEKALKALAEGKDVTKQQDEIENPFSLRFMMQRLEKGTKKERDAMRDRSFSPEGSLHGSHRATNHSPKRRPRSPERRGRRDRDRSPPRRESDRSRRESSPPRRLGSSARDHVVPRERRGHHRSSPPRRSSRSSPPRRTDRSAPDRNDPMWGGSPAPVRDPRGGPPQVRGVSSGAEGGRMYSERTSSGPRLTESRGE